MKQDDTFSELLELARQLDEKEHPAVLRCRMASGVLVVLFAATITAIISMLLVHILGLDSLVIEYEVGRKVYISVVLLFAITIFLKHIFVWRRKG